MIRSKIANPITQFVTSEEIRSIEQVADEFVSAGFGNKIFFHKDLSSKLQQLWKILQDIYNNDPNIVIGCVMHIIEKKIPKTLGESGKYEFMDNSLVKCSRTSKKINTVTDFIFDQVKSDANTHSLDVLSICGMLLSFAVNSQSHLYLAMENIKKAADILSKNYDIEEIFSIESKVVQNTKSIADIQAIRNAVSHGSFNLGFNENTKEYFVDFESVLTGYSFNKRYTGTQFITSYSDYDKLRNFQGDIILQNNS